MVDIKNVDYGEHLGYSEMFEFAEQRPINNVIMLGKLVQFCPEYPNYIIRARNTKNIVGITSINTAYRASDPDEWPYRYLQNEYGDLYLKEETIAKAEKKYDSINEFSYLSTFESTVHVPIDNNIYDETVLFFWNISFSARA